MNKKKNLFKGLLLVSIATLTFVGCGKSKDKKTSKKVTTESRVTTVAPTPTPDPEPVKIDGNFCYVSVKDFGVIVNSDVKEGVLKTTNVFIMGGQPTCIQFNTNVENGKLKSVDVCHNMMIGNDFPINYLTVKNGNNFVQLASFTDKNYDLSADENHDFIYTIKSLSVKVSDDKFTILYGDSTYVFNLDGTQDLTDLCNIPGDNVSIPIYGECAFSFNNDCLTITEGTSTTTCTFKNKNVEYADNQGKSGLKHEADGNINYYTTRYNPVAQEYQLFSQIVIQLEDNKVKKFVAKQGNMGVSYDYTYSNDGNVITIDAGEVPSNYIYDLAIYVGNPTRNVITLDANGNIIKREIWEIDGETETLLLTYEYEYDNKGNLTGSLMYDNSSIASHKQSQTMTYDANNKVLVFIDYAYDNAGEKYVSAKRTYAYSSEGMCKEYCEYKGNDTLTKKITKTYDSTSYATIYKVEEYSYSTDENIITIKEYDNSTLKWTVTQTTYKGDTPYISSISKNVYNGYYDYNSTLLSEYSTYSSSNQKLTENKTEYELIDNKTHKKTETRYELDIDNNRTTETKIEYINNYDQYHNYEIEHTIETIVKNATTGDRISKTEIIKNIDENGNIDRIEIFNYEETDTSYRKETTYFDNDGKPYVYELLVRRVYTEDGYDIDDYAVMHFSDNHQTIDYVNTYKTVEKKKTGETINEEWHYDSNSMNFDRLVSRNTTITIGNDTYGISEEIAYVDNTSTIDSYRKEKTLNGALTDQENTVYVNGKKSTTAINHNVIVNNQAFIQFVYEYTYFADSGLAKSVNYYEADNPGDSAILKYTQTAKEESVGTNDYRITQVIVIEVDDNNISSIYGYLNNYGVDPATHTKYLFNKIISDSQPEDYDDLVSDAANFTADPSETNFPGERKIDVENI